MSESGGDFTENTECILIDVPNSVLLQQPYYKPVTCSTESNYK